MTKWLHFVSKVRQRIRKLLIFLSLTWWSASGNIFKLVKSRELFWNPAFYSITLGLEGLFLQYLVDSDLEILELDLIWSLKMSAVLHCSSEGSHSYVSDEKFYFFSFQIRLRKLKTRIIKTPWTSLFVIKSLQPMASYWLDWWFIIDK